MKTTREEHGGYTLERVSTTVTEHDTILVLSKPALDRLLHTALVNVPEILGSPSNLEKVCKGKVSQE